MPTSTKQPSRIPMWRGVKFSYLIIGLCLFPLAMGGYWAYGNLVSIQSCESFSSTHFSTSNLHPIKEPENSPDEVKTKRGKNTKQENKIHQEFLRLFDLYQFTTV